MEPFKPEFSRRLSDSKKPTEKVTSPPITKTIPNLCCAHSLIKSTLSFWSVYEFDGFESILYILTYVIVSYGNN